MDLIEGKFMSDSVCVVVCRGDQSSLRLDSRGGALALALVCGQLNVRS
jgi:hypothetical protein